MQLWELLMKIGALLILSVEATQPRGTDEAQQILLSDPNFRGEADQPNPTITASDELENSHDTSNELETSNPDDFSRFLRGRDSYIRFGRSRNDNFMRFGRGKQDNFMRFGRSSKEPGITTDEHDRIIRSGKANKKRVNDKFERLTKNFIRLGRGKQDNFMRFGRAKPDNIIRFGRGKQDNFMRFGRGKQDNFMRFGRGKQDNFMRFGRVKQDNFMRFGRGKQDNFMRFGRGKDGSYMRFGRDIANLYLPARTESIDFNNVLNYSIDKHDKFGRKFMDTSYYNTPIATHSSLSDSNNLDRLLRSRLNNFLRIGKTDADQQSSPPFEFSEILKKTPILFDPGCIKTSVESPQRNSNYSFFDWFEYLLNSIKKSCIFIKAKRHPPVEMEENHENTMTSNLHEGISDRLILPVMSLTDSRDENLSSSDQLEGKNNRKKRSVEFKLPPSSSIVKSTLSTDDGSSKLLDDSEKRPNIIVIPLFLPTTTSSVTSEE